MGYRQYDHAGRYEAQYDTDGRVVWRSDAAPAALLPAANTVTWTGDIAFPDFIKGNAMYFNWTGPDETGTWAQTWAVVRPGEWGPDKSGVYLLSRTLLGAMPAGANFLDVVVNLTCTHAPDLYLAGSIDFKYGFPEGKSVNLDGGCALLERQNKVWMRMIRVVAIGGGIYLERYQSVKAQSDCLAPFPGSNWKSDPQVFTTGYDWRDWLVHWTHDGDKSGWLAYPMSQSIGGGTSELNKARGWTFAPSTTDTSDFSATWHGTITVRPGYAHS